MQGKRGRRWIAPAALALLGLVSACTASPSPVVRSTATTSTPPPSATVTNTVVIAVDDIGAGFNPHELADLSPVNTAVSSLVLPSVFQPDTTSPDSTSPDSTSAGWALDSSTAVSATPSTTDSSTAPFSVTYVLRNDAQWSDGAPIAAEDFRYLWQQMITQSGVSDPAGYSLITDVASSSGGKTVTVSFSAQYPAWRELFRNLLPAHLMKDLPGGFGGALDDALPVSGSRFKVKTIDRDRGEVLLERNDRFWGTPTVLDSILLRRDGTAGQLAESLRSKDAQLAQVHANEATRTQLAAIPELRTLTVPQPNTMRIAADVTRTGIPDGRVREALFALLDPDALSTIGAGRAVGTYRAGAQVLVPSQLGYVSTRPDPISAAAAKAKLVDAGYTFESGKYLKNGAPLAVVIGAAEEDSAATSIAQAVADQLTVAGVDATASIVSSAELYGRSLGSGKIAMVVGRAPAGGDEASILAATFGCVPQAPPTTTTSAPTTSTTTSPTPTASSSPKSSTPTRLGNISGVCERSLQPQIDAALTGAADARATVATLEPQLWALHAILPLYQDTTLLAVRKQVNGVGDPGPLLSGPFAGAATWSRADR